MKIKINRLLKTWFIINNELINIDKFKRNWIASIGASLVFFIFFYVWNIHCGGDSHICSFENSETEE